MIKYLKTSPWQIIEETFSPEHHKASESIFSLGNGSFGQRANFEEAYSGASLQGTYIAGVYYPDKTKVGWWKNGYPEYFAKVLNACNFTGINIEINGESLDLAKCEVLSFKRTLDMKEGTLNRNFSVIMPSEIKLEVSACRFLSMDNHEIGAIRYAIKALSDSVVVKFSPYLDGNVVNEDANWDDIFWDQISHDIQDNEAYLVSRTKKTEFELANGMLIRSLINGVSANLEPANLSKEAYVECSYICELEKDSTLEIQKYISVLSSLHHDKHKILDQSKKVLRKACEQGFNSLLKAHRTKWNAIWENSDVTINGDPEAQQGIRFNIFHLNQTYTGKDDRLNIGPKGFTGEKYGGASYWDTEAYCLPFYLTTSPKEVSRNLLIYRYKHLEKAIENASKLGFNNGAALYPMVTMNGEECHNEWEITFEEIHRNGAIAYAIYNYIRHTNDKDYLREYGLEVLIALSRFWAQRVNYSSSKSKYVILGVTGPNEYENNVNNNWYTNTIAIWTMEYCLESMAYVQKTNTGDYAKILEKTQLDPEKECTQWKKIIANMYYPILENQGVFAQQDGFMDKEQITVNELDYKHRPINQKWSWDRILRSCLIKQADVLQGIYFFEDRFDLQTIERNFDFYEPRTVHESSLSPCVHVVIATKLDRMDKAYELYMRTSRLDIDDYNHEVHEGLHITSMAGTYMSIIEGFAGKRIIDNTLCLNPKIPANWTSYSFKILFRTFRLKLDIQKTRIDVHNESDVEAHFKVFDSNYKLSGKTHISIPMD